jgi:hypothetical protein
MNNKVRAIYEKLSPSHKAAIRGSAHDSLKPTTLLWAAFILSLIHRLGSSTTETVGPQDYDLRTYQPPKKRW